MMLSTGYFTYYFFPHIQAKMTIKQQPVFETGSYPNKKLLVN